MPNYIKIDFAEGKYGSEIKLVTDQGEFRIPYCSAEIKATGSEITICMLEVEVNELVANIPIDNCDYEIITKDNDA